MASYIGRRKFLATASRRRGCVAAHGKRAAGSDAGGRAPHFYRANGFLTRIGR
jgi:hypothetical protein